MTLEPGTNYIIEMKRVGKCTFGTPNQLLQYFSVPPEELWQLQTSNRQVLFSGTREEVHQFIASSLGDQDASGV